MSPDLKEWGAAISRAILEETGKTPERTQELENELNEATAKKDFAKVSTIASELAGHKELAEDLDTVISDLADVLERHRIADLNVPFSALEEVAKPKAEETEMTVFEAVAPQEDEQKRRREPEKYINHAAANVALKLIEKTAFGRRFKYKSLEEIGKSILQDSQKKNKGAVKNAKLYAYTVLVQRLGRGIPQYASEKGAKTMKEVVDSLLPEIKNKAWNSFYQEVAGRFGQLSPQEFVDSVVLRLVRGKKEAVQVRKAIETKKRKERIRPGDLTPMDELVLCNRLTASGTLDNIERFLGTEKNSKILKGLGWKDLAGTWSDFDANRREMAQKRGAVRPTDEEGKISIRKILAAIDALSKDRRGWHTLNRDFRGFVFLSAVVGEIGDDSLKIQALVDILFPRKTYQTDSNKGFLLMGIEQN